MYYRSYEYCDKCKKRTMHDWNICLDCKIKKIKNWTIDDKGRIIQKNKKIY